MHSEPCGLELAQREKGDQDLGCCTQHGDTHRSADGMRNAPRGHGRV